MSTERRGESGEDRRGLVRDDGRPTTRDHERPARHRESFDPARSGQARGGTPERGGGERRNDRKPRTGQADRSGGNRPDRRPPSRQFSPDDRETPRPPSVAAPELPEELAGVQLDAEVRQDLRGLRKDVAEDVARHLVAAGTLLEADAAQALAHARYARSKASRLAVVREATGVAAYYAGEWAEAIAELRAARRMGGGPGHLAVLADAERALGRPERALEITRSPEAADLGRDEAIELVIVASGARRDLGELDAAVIALQVPELDGDVVAPWNARLRYAYADALLTAGRRDEAVRWFLRTVEIDDEELTDAADRLAELVDEPTPEDPAGQPLDAVDSADGAPEPDQPVEPADAAPAEEPAEEPEKLDEPSR